MKFASLFGILFYCLFILLVNSFKNVELKKIAASKSIEIDQSSFCNVTIQFPITQSHFRYRKQYPLVFNENGKLYTTTSHHEIFSSTNSNLGINVNDQSKYDMRIYVAIKNDEIVYLSCGPNYLMKFGRMTSVKAKCLADAKGGKFLLLNDDDETKEEESIFSINDLNCDLRVVEDIIVPVEGCSNNNWIATKFGIVHPIDEVTYVLGEACFDANEGRTIFTHVKVGGTEDFNYLEKGDKQLLTSHRHTDGRYKIELMQNLMFDEINERIYKFTKKHSNLQLRHYLEGNSLGNLQLLPVEKLGWNYVLASNNDISKLLADYILFNRGDKNDIFDVYIGSYGVYELLSPDGQKKDFYLQDLPDERQRFPVPKYFWILIKHEDKAIAFEIQNRVLTDGEEFNFPTSDMICDVIECKDVKWLHETSRSDMEWRRLKCCTYDELKKIVPEVPMLADIKNVLM